MSLSFVDTFEQYEKARRVRLHIGLVCAVVFATMMFNTANAQAEDRTLRLYNVHTKETLVTTYKKNGRYQSGELKKLNHLLRDWRRNQPTKMDPRLFDLVWNVLGDLNARGKTIHVVSGFRSKKTNDDLRRRGRKTARFSQHVNGRAMDFKVPGISSHKVRAAALKYHAGGVGHYPTFTHLDTGSVRHWPRMSRKQLVSVFPKGNTIHVPSDGRPLSGYKTAMALHKSGKLTLLDKKGDVKKTSGSLFARLFGSSNKKEETKTISAKPAGTRQVAKVAAAPVSKQKAKTTDNANAEEIIARAKAKAKEVEALKEQEAAPQETVQPFVLANLPKARPVFDDGSNRAARIQQQQDSQSIARLALAPLPDDQLASNDPLKALSQAEQVSTFALAAEDLPQANPVRGSGEAAILLVSTPDFDAYDTLPDVPTADIRVIARRVTNTEVNTGSIATGTPTLPLLQEPMRASITPNIWANQAASVEKINKADAAIARAQALIKTSRALREEAASKLKAQSR